MVTSTPRTPSDAQPPAQETLAALRASGPSALAELLGDVDHLLSEVATAPKAMFSPHGRARAEYKNLLDMVHAARSALEVLEVRTMVALAEVTTRDAVHAAQNDAAHEDDFLPPLEQLITQSDAKTAQDVSLATRRSPSVANSTMATSRRLVTSMPGMLRALAAGKITSAVAHAAASTAAPLDDLQRRQLDRHLVEKMPQLDGAGVKRWRKAVAASITELDPRGAEDRHRTARTHRHVSFTPGEHGMATLSVHLPALDARLAHKRLSLEAERRRAEGARAGHGALMADAFTDTVLGREGSMEPVTLDIGLIITDRALLDPGCDDVAHLEGYGPVPVESVREELRAVLEEPDQASEDRYGPDGPQIRVALRRLYTHPTVGELVGVEARGREFPPALRRFLIWRDDTCRAPFCDAPVRHMDHIVPFSEGGATSLENGQGLCARCNLRKEDGAARVERLDGDESTGHLVAWTGTGGARVVTTAQALGPLPAEEQEAPLGAEFSRTADPGALAGDGGGDPEITSSGEVACHGETADSISCRIPAPAPRSDPDPPSPPGVLAAHRPDDMSLAGGKALNHRTIEHSCDRTLPARCFHAASPRHTLICGPVRACLGRCANISNRRRAPSRNPDASGAGAAPRTRPPPTDRRETPPHDLSSTPERAATPARRRDRPGLGRPAARGRLRRRSRRRARGDLRDGGAPARPVR